MKASRSLTTFLALGFLLGQTMIANAEDKAAANAPVVRTTSKPGAKVFLIEPRNGATVTGPVTVKFGAEGIELGKAADGIKENSGHHHLLVDLDKLPDLNAPLPSNEHINHFGQAQTETTINLAPGKHTLQLLLGDAKHVPLNPPVMSEKISITVK